MVRITIDIRSFSRTSELYNQFKYVYKKKASLLSKDGEDSRGERVPKVQEASNTMGERHVFILCKKV